MSAQSFFLKFFVGAAICSMMTVQADPTAAPTPELGEYGCGCVDSLAAKCFYTPDATRTQRAYYTCFDNSTDVLGSVNQLNLRNMNYINLGHISACDYKGYGQFDPIVAQGSYCGAINGNRELTIETVCVPGAPRGGVTTEDPACMYHTVLTGDEFCNEPLLFACLGVTAAPSAEPTTASPTAAPSAVPTAAPTATPTLAPFSIVSRGTDPAGEYTYTYYVVFGEDNFEIQQLRARNGALSHSIGFVSVQNWGSGGTYPITGGDFCPGKGAARDGSVIVSCGAELSTITTEPTVCTYEILITGPAFCADRR